MKTEVKDNTLDQIEDFIREMVERFLPAQNEPVGRGRPRILPALCLWAGVMVCVLRGWNSQLAIWRLLYEKDLWDYPRFPISDQAVYKRLEQEGEGPLKWLFEQTSLILKERLHPYQHHLASFASQVVAIDETRLDQVLRHVPILRSYEKGDPHLLPGKLAGVYDIRLQQWSYAEHIQKAEENDKVSAPLLLSHIEPGALILMDLGFFSFPWFDQLTQEGYYWISRLRQGTSFKVIHTFYQQGDTFDGWIRLGAYRSDQARFVVRLICFRVGGQVYRYITNVLSPHLLSIKEVATLYARRWDIEMAFKLIKRELGLHLFWSGKAVVMLEQIWAVLLISQILHALQLEIAARAGVDPFDVSLPLLVEYLPRWREVDFLTRVVERGRETGFIRPSRRIRIQAPEIDLSHYHSPPPDLELTVAFRYAFRRSHDHD